MTSHYGPIRENEYKKLNVLFKFSKVLSPVRIDAT